MWRELQRVLSCWNRLPKDGKLHKKLLSPRLRMRPPWKRHGGSPLGGRKFAGMWLPELDHSVWASRKHLEHGCAATGGEALPIHGAATGTGRRCSFLPHVPTVAPTEKAEHCAHFKGESLKNPIHYHRTSIKGNFRLRGNKLIVGKEA